MVRRGHESAFSLIELMTVIAVIGILASIATVTLGGSRSRAALKNAESAMQSARAIAALCVFRGSNIVAPAPLGNPTNRVCDGGEKWPQLSSVAPGWAYVNTSFEGDVGDRQFTFEAGGPNSGKITCRYASCMTTP